MVSQFWMKSQGNPGGLGLPLRVWRQQRAAVRWMWGLRHRI